MNPRDADIAAAGFGIAVGHATDAIGATGCTVVRGVNAPLRASGTVVGRATGTREWALLDPWASADRIDAVLLTGGSAYGLDAAAGVMQWMEERGRGFEIGGGVVPIVPAAVVFDLGPLGAFRARPSPSMAYDACERATTHGWEEGSVGAGTGCTVGKLYGPRLAMKGGLGVGVAGSAGGLMACAIAAVNAVGHVRDFDGSIIAGPRDPGGGIADSEAVAAARGFFVSPEANTTISLVALNQPFPKVELNRIARAAAVAHARRIGPAGTSYDGDVVFAVSPAGAPQGADAVRAEIIATQALEEAIVRAVRTAKGRDGIPGLAG
ncbi:MAG: P1 family peptidase [Gemmatimonadaceae bacterium]|nr:P1 family peptidase [Gemmatimonadaceae bacterium]